MRRLHRGILDLSVRLELATLAKAATSSDAVRIQWSLFIQRKTGGRLKAELERMAHSRNRCVYCDDSRGADVDHFWPISPHFDRAFDWRNHLWSCSECNRKKAISFPTVAGIPQLLNPVEENWWEFLTLDTSSGVLTARWHSSGVEDPRGVATLRVFRALTYESVIEGRYRAIVALTEAAEKAVTAGNSETARAALIRAVRYDEYGVTDWFALGPGAHEAPFATLRDIQGLWRRFVRLAVARQYGSPTL